MLILINRNYKSVSTCVTSTLVLYLCVSIINQQLIGDLSDDRLLFVLIPLMLVKDIE